MKRIIPILLVLALVTGCVQISTVSSKLPGLPQKAEPGLITTTQSILVDIKNPTDGEQISSKYEFTPTVTVTDTGHADSEGVVCISGPSEDVLKGFTGCECQYFTLYAYDEDGEVQEQLEFGPYNINIEEEKEELMTVTTRYTYETTGTAKACIKKDMYSPGGCQIENIGGSKKNLLTKCTNGAVTINKVTEEIIPIDDETVTLTFSVEVEKASKGNIYDYDKAGYPSCRAEETQNKRIRGEIQGLPGGDVQCTEAELNEDGEGTLTCEAENINILSKISGESYEPEIEIILEYGYEQIQSVKFQVSP